MVDWKEVFVSDLRRRGQAAHDDTTVADDTGSRPVGAGCSIAVVGRVGVIRTHFQSVGWSVGLR